MTTICITKKYYNIPTEWNELSAKQILQVMDVLFLKGYNAEHILLRLVQVLTGISEYRFLKADVRELDEFFYLTAFLLKPDIEFTKNILPFWPENDLQHFYGPDDALNNLRMKEFTLTEDLYMRWWDSDKQDIDALNELVAILYRPAPEDYDFEKNEAGDFREPFNQNVSSFYAKKYISKWPMNTRLAIAAWYNGCRLHIVASNPEVFAGAGGDPALFGLVSVMLDVAETRVFGPFKEVEEQYVNLVLMHLNQALDKGKKMEAASK